MTREQARLFADYILGMPDRNGADDYVHLSPFRLGESMMRGRAARGISVVIVWQSGGKGALELPTPPLDLPGIARKGRRRKER
jgi:hypothetical protein